jgi:NAD(P)-dependent dehydrogenase (short-subunit alcohol dehydrogenase family)
MTAGAGMQGCVCVITGAGRGIGRVLARRYAGAGACVVLAGRQLAPLDETAALVRDAGGSAHSVRCDLRDEDDCRRLVTAALDTFGRVDVLLNNAAVPGTDQPVMAMDLANWNDTIATDLTGPMLLSREVLARAMIPAGAGNIQFFSSAAAKDVLPGKAHYAVAKLGLVPLAQTLAIEVGELGIRANTLVIGTVAGDLVDAWADRVADGEGVDRSEVLGRLAQGAALGRLVTADEVADVSLWLASDAASAVTGQAINVTAGAEKR